MNKLYGIRFYYTKDEFTTSNFNTEEERDDAYNLIAKYSGASLVYMNGTENSVIVNLANVRYIEKCNG